MYILFTYFTTISFHTLNLRHNALYENHDLFRFVCRFVQRELFDISQIHQRTAIRKVGMDFPTTLKSATQLDTFPSFGSENIK